MELKHTTIQPVAKRLVLLIVPYGIETSKAYRDRMMTELLIVPYGIETIITNSDSLFLITFNRTLWN